MQPLLEMTQHEFAELCGVNRESIRLWTLEGMPGVSKPTRNSAYIDLRVALPWVRANKWANADDHQRLARIKADTAQLDLDLKLGSLMNVADAVATWERQCSGMRARLLSIPSTALSQAGLSTNQAESVRDLIYEALEALSGRKDAPPEDWESASGQAAKRPLPVGQKMRGRKRRG